ncbi:tyrosine-type recombinase/integrase [Joostella sp.]|uniref:tyrosine-type recombinase/integrase n=1 Tax=Joostella sp. TaxID=2231138 RepID=UPI003A8FB8A1
MASIRYTVKSKKNPANIYIRFYDSKIFDIIVKTGFIINPKSWSNKQQRVTNSLDSIFEAKRVNPQLIGLKEFIIEEYNAAYSNGDLITKNWLSNRVLRYNNRPSEEFLNYEIFFVPFVEKFILDSKTRVNPSTGKILSKKTIQKYNTTLERLKEFQFEEDITLKIWDIDLQFHNKFLHFLKVIGNYGSTTIEKYLSQIKTFCREAKTLGYRVNPEFEHRNFTIKREKPIDVYLDKNEIQKIYSLDLSKNKRLDNSRDLMIIGLWTGLRISDLKRLSEFSITDNTIDVIDSTKTSISLKIPMHEQVKYILKKRENDLPKIISDQKYNKDIKEICKLARIEQVVMGSKLNSETKRKEKGYYPKYELVSSHTCRRSFATNHYGELPNQTIMSITGHKSEQQFIKYVKTTKEEHSQKVRDLWAEQSQLSN